MITLTVLLSISIGVNLYQRGLLSRYVDEPTAEDWILQNTKAVELAEEFAKEAITLRERWAAIPVIAIDRMVRFGSTVYMPDSRETTHSVIYPWLDENWPWVSEIDELDNYPNRPE